MSEFAKLLEELTSVAEQTSTLAKSLPADGEDDKAIQAAAADGEADENPEDADDGAADEEAEEAETDDKPMAKSLTIDGEEMEVIDGEVIMKSLNAMGTRLTSNEEVMAKALSSVTQLVTQQNTMIKSLSDKVEKLSGQGKGRKTVLAIHERPAPATLAKSEDKGMTGQQIMAKSLAAQGSGKLTGLEVARVEQHLNLGLPVPTDILAKL